MEELQPLRWTCSLTEQVPNTSPAAFCFTSAFSEPFILGWEVGFEWEAVSKAGVENEDEVDFPLGEKLDFW